VSDKKITERYIKARKEADGLLELPVAKVTYLLMENERLHEQLKDAARANVIALTALREIKHHVASDTNQFTGADAGDFWRIAVHALAKVRNISNAPPPPVSISSLPSFKKKDEQVEVILETLEDNVATHQNRIPVQIKEE
jgi:hypothetical protein